MKFGSKGLDAPTVIGIIVAIIIAVVVIFILWTRGFLQFTPAADRSLCLSEILDACAGYKKLSDVNKACAGIKDIGDAAAGTGATCRDCILETAGIDCSVGTTNYQACCESIRALPS